MDFHAMCRWLRGQRFPTNLSQVRQDLLFAAAETPEGVSSAETTQALFKTLDQVLRALSLTKEFKLSGDLSTPALTKVERCPPFQNK